MENPSNPRHRALTISRPSHPYTKLTSAYSRYTYARNFLSPNAKIGLKIKNFESTTPGVLSALKVVLYTQVN